MSGLLEGDSGGGLRVSEPRTGPLRAAAPWPVRQWMGIRGGAAPAGRSAQGWRRRAGTRGGGGHADGGEAAVKAPQFRERPELSPPQTTTKV